MSHDVAVKVLLDPAEFLAMRQIADSEGLSQSSYIRQLIKRDISVHTDRVLRAALDASAEVAHK